MTKVLIAGSWQWPIYQQACSDALSQEGVKVIKFSWGNKFLSFIGRIESHTCIPMKDIFNLNKELLQLCKKEKPDFILIWSCRYLFNSTITKIKKMGIITISYNNDDPFSKRKLNFSTIYQQFFWWRFKSNIPFFDMNFVYREKNIEEYIALGGKHVRILPAYYVPSMNYVDFDEKEFREGVFIGHYENDERFTIIKLLRNNGLNVDIFGTGWSNSKLNISESSKIKPLRGAKYNKTISSSKFALCFFSKINNDSYTRRVFEITAAGTLLVAPYNKTIAKLFIDGEEALLYRNANDLIERLQKISRDKAELDRISENGRKRCTSSGYDVLSRMQHFLSIIQEYKLSNRGLKN